MIGPRGPYHFDPRDYEPEELSDSTSSGEIDWVPPYYVTWLDKLCFGLMWVAAQIGQSVWSRQKWEDRQGTFVIEYPVMSGKGVVWRSRHTWLTSAFQDGWKPERYV